MNDGDGYPDAIQARPGGDAFEATIEMMPRRMVEEPVARNVGAERHERGLWRNAQAAPGRLLEAIPKP